MSEISNKTLAVLVVLVIIISFVALFAAGKFKIIKTGRAGEGTVGNISLEVITDININATDAGISFGNMLPQQWNNSEVAGDNITIEIVGVTTVDIDYWSNMSMFTGRNGTGSFVAISPRNRQSAEDEGYGIKILDRSTCKDYDDTNLGGWCDNSGGYSEGSFDAVCVSTDIYENVSIRENVTAEGDDALRHLIGYCPKDAVFTIGIHVHVPEAEPTGYRSSLLSFRAIEYGSYN